MNQLEATTRDLRQHSPTILAVSCEDSNTAYHIQQMLEKEPPRQNQGNKSAVTKQRPEVQYCAFVHDTAVLAGRIGIVSHITRMFVESCCGMSLFIGRVRLKHPFGDSGQDIVAAVVANSSSRNRRGSGDDWLESEKIGHIGSLCQKHLVRFLAGEFQWNLVNLVNQMRRAVITNVAAWAPFTVRGRNPPRTRRYAHKASSILALGPVQSIQLHFEDEPELDEGQQKRWGRKEFMLPDFPWGELREHLGPDRLCVEDASSRWAELGAIRQKNVLCVQPGTVKLSMYCDHKTRWRALGKIAVRNARANRETRAGGPIPR